MSNSLRIFLKKTGIASMAVMAGSSAISNEKIMPRPSPGGSGPLVISTWKNGLQANETAMKKIMDGHRALDAVEAGVRVVEADSGKTLKVKP